jgi:hypothetical protein
MFLKRNPHARTVAPTAEKILWKRHVGTNRPARLAAGASGLTGGTAGGVAVHSQRSIPSPAGCAMSFSFRALRCVGVEDASK